MVAAAQQPQPTVAPTPPMGWNSWDTYGLTITEPQFRANVDVLQRQAPALWLELCCHRRRLVLREPERPPHAGQAALRHRSLRPLRSRPRALSFRCCARLAIATDQPLRCHAQTLSHHRIHQLCNPRRLGALRRASSSAFTSCAVFRALRSSVICRFRALTSTRRTPPTRPTPAHGIPPTGAFATTPPARPGMTRCCASTPPGASICSRSIASPTIPSSSTRSR